MQLARNFSDQTNKLNRILLFLLVSSILFFPPIIHVSRYVFGLEEAIVGVSSLALIVQFKQIQFSNYAKIIVLFIAIIAISLILHRKSTHLSDTLELYETFKFLVVFLLAANTSFDQQKIRSYILWSFSILLIINLLHFFNAFSINKHFIILYDTDKRDTLYFGLDSLLRPGPKRIIGTLGNPNDNAIVLLFYFAFLLKETCKNAFVAKWKVLRSIDFYFSSAALMLIVMTQSRTAFLVLALVFVLMLISLFTKEKLNIFQLLVVILIFATSILFSVIVQGLDLFIGNHADLSYLQSGIEMAENTSMAERIRIWKIFIGEFLQKPIIGWGSQKEYLYAKELHTDNEYVLTAWRYGILGLAVHLCLIFYYVGSAWRRYNLEILIAITSIAVVSITNAPLSHAKISLLFFIIIGSFASQLNTQSPENFTNNKWK